MTVRVPTDRIPSLCGTTTGLRQLVQAVGGDASERKGGSLPLLVTVAGDGQGVKSRNDIRPLPSWAAKHLEPRASPPAMAPQQPVGFAADVGGPLANKAAG